MCIRGGMLDGRVRLRLYVRIPITTHAICGVLAVQLEQEGSNILAGGPVLDGPCTDIIRLVGGVLYKISMACKNPTSASNSYYTE